MVGKTLMTLAVVAGVTHAFAQGPGRIYTKPAADDPAFLTGKTNAGALSHVIAVERDRKRVYLAELDGGKTGFRFGHLPAGRYDLVLVTADGSLFEGLELGGEPAPDEESAGNATRRVAEADSFFNRHKAHRAGLADGVVLALVERIRDREILRGSGERLNACLRRIEIMEMREASGDWQTTGTRHIYREEIPLTPAPEFLRHRHVAALGGIRVVDKGRDLGMIELSKETP